MTIVAHNSKIYLVMSTQVSSRTCPGTWREGRKPGDRPNMTPSFWGYFTSKEFDRPIDWCKWSETPRRRDARVLGGPKPSYGGGTPTMNSHCTNDWGIGEGTAGINVEMQTPAGSLNLPRQSVELAKNHYSPSIKTINEFTHNTPDTRLQHPPLRYYT